MYSMFFTCWYFPVLPSGLTPYFNFSKSDFEKLRTLSTSIKFHLDKSALVAQ